MPVENGAGKGNERNAEERLDGIGTAEWRRETALLERMRTLIRTQLLESKKRVSEIREKILTTNRNMWKDLPLPTGNFEADFDMFIQSNQYLKERTTQILTYELQIQTLKRLERMYLTPFFGRIQFREKYKEEKEDIYIGIATLFDDREDCLIYDWRAPVSSMFYDYGLGPAEYSCKEGAVSGEIMGKRQYRIEDGVLQYMFDTNLTIDDEILQRILSQSAVGKMKQIITSIQREQNRVIRNDRHDLLIVQGPAGSGKTSIALHRAAYLLYKYRNQIDSENILIFSPNQIFSDYISNVLPELGEENITQLTFQEYADGYLQGAFQSEDVFDQLEYFYSASPTEERNTRVGGVRFKSSQAYYQLVQSYVRNLEEEFIRRFEPVCYLGETVAGVDELRRLWHEYRYLPLRKRLKKIRRRIFTMFKPAKKKRIHELEEQLLAQYKDPNFNWFKEAVLMMRAELAPLYDRMEEWVCVDVTALYFALFHSPETGRHAAGELALPENWEAICRQTEENWEQGKVFYEDVAPLVLFRRALTGEGRTERKIRHIFIDEAQDYSPFQYEVIHQHFPGCKLTVLGDRNQRVHPYLGLSDYRTIADIFALQTTEMIQLHKSYRSTREIASFARQLLNLPEEDEMVNRSGDKPRVVLLPAEKLVSALVRGIGEVREKGAQSIGIITKTAAEGAELHRQLQAELPLHLVTKDDSEFMRDAVVIPSYLAKGLEFDAVFVCLPGAGAYRPDEANLLYMVCTRALHHLHLYQVGASSPWLVPISGEFYEMERETEPVG